jgi:hypothetical protein
MELVAGAAMTAHPRRYFSQPYGFRDWLLWLVHNLLGPSHRHRSLTPWLPSKCTLNAVRPARQLAFVGDVLPTRRTAVRIGDDVREFLRSADLLVANFEGTIVDGPTPPVFMGQAHSPAVLDLLAQLFPPERTVLCCANNHAGDYGRAQFCRSWQRLEDRGFTVIGRADRPAVIVDGPIAIASGTIWSNQPCDYVSRLHEAAALDARAAFRVLCPHWGYELHRYPDPEQVDLARRLLGRWDLVVGHHSHCPQPVTQLDAGTNTRRAVAYSLGNFTFGLDLRHHLQGLVLKLSVGPGPTGRWGVGRLEWRATEIRFERRHRATVRLAPRDESGADPVLTQRR